MSTDNYSLQKPGGLIDHLALKKRKQMYQAFLEVFPLDSFASVLDVGVTADRAALSSNYFEKLYPHKENIITLSNQDASFLKELYPGLSFYYGDACQLPFAANSIDIVFSSAVIEHVGHVTKQARMLTECLRVAKQGVFITTPNRWHPVEIHTLLPLLHWLPKNLHRKILHLLGFKLYAHETTLNLMGKKDLQLICNTLNIKNFTIKHIKTLGLTSNLLLIIQKGMSA